MNEAGYFPFKVIVADLAARLNYKQFNKIISVL